MILEQYKDTMSRIIQMYYPISKDELEPILDWSISKRYKEHKCEVVNTYTNQKSYQTLLAIADYIASKEPIVTSYGTMFKKHGTVKNPIAIVTEQFLSERDTYKKEMFKWPKGSEDFEKFNLLQSLAKIDVNGLYGAIGMYLSLIYNINVATSVTSQGRTAVSSMMCCFESFLANTVKFGSVDEVLVFIDHVKNEKPKRKFKNSDILDKPVTKAECFTKLMWSSGYRWIPDEEEMEIIWRVVNNLSQEELDRVYYKNNLYEFLMNSKISNMIVTIMKTLKTPYLNPMKCPPEIKDQMDEFAAILKEYVYYGHMIIDRIDRAENMIKNICIISDTDSTIISLDAWYRFANKLIEGQDLQICKYKPMKVLDFLEKDEFGDYKDKSKLNPIEYFDDDYDYNFDNDELIELKHVINPLEIYPEDNVRHSLINMMAYVLDGVVNDYMVQLTKSSHSYQEGRKCRLYAKNEFLFKRVLMTEAKKNYASIQELQEGNAVVKDKQLDVKGLDALAKSTTAEKTREELRKILLEDILNTPVVDQFKVIKDIAVLEKRIHDTVTSGSREFYKPVTIKSQSNYKDPTRISGIKASYAWNMLKPDSENLPSINLDERNAIDIAKVDVNKFNVDQLKEKYLEVYENAIKLMEDPMFKGKIEAVAIPMNVIVPEWLLEIVDYKTIINNNISGFPFESIGIKRLNRNSINYTNIIQL